jgi:hypothetical protein
MAACCRSRCGGCPRRTGRSGLLLPAISLGLWYNFGGVDPLENGRAMLRRAFDLGITHFDLANNYGPPPGSAEETFGRIFAQDLKPYRDELIISSKAGYYMWPGPYGEWGSRKYLVASIDQSLKRMGLDYVDIFYSHRPDPHTPLEETMGALDYIVRSGRALYAGISTYSPEQTRQAAAILRPRHPLPHPPAALQHVRPLDRRPACWTRWPRRASAASLFAAGPGHSHRQVPAGRSPTTRARPSWTTSSTGATRSRRSGWRRCAGSTPSPRRAARAWPRWPSPGCCAIPA